MIETTRLLLRRLTLDDYKELCEILQDSRTMKAYEHAFSDDEVTEWINKQLTRYAADGFGLWAVILKDTGKLIGQCGLTMQDIPNKRVVEIGYLFNSSYWHNGYAIEAAKACKDYAFNTFGINEVYSIIRDTNTSSINVALNNGMTKVGEFIKHYQGIDMLHVVYNTIKTNKPHYEIASAFIKSDNKFLITKRMHEVMNELWELPGGKIEPGETSKTAVIREIKEELNVEVSVVDYIDNVYYDYPQFSITLHLLNCKLNPNNIALTVHSEFAWIEFKDIDSYKLAEADYLLLRRLGEKHRFGQ